MLCDSEARNEYSMVFFKPINGIPDLKGSLSAAMLSTTIVSATVPVSCIGWHSSIG